MPRSGDDSDGVESDHPGILKFCLHLGERLHRVSCKMHTGEAQRVRMLHYVDEGDDARPALRRVKPVATPRIIGDVAVAAIPDVDAVEAVVEDRNPDKEQLQQKNAWQAVEKLDLLSVGDRAFESLGIRDEVFE